MTSPESQWPTEWLIDRSSPIPVYYQIAVELERRIRSGTLPPGAQLENEIALGRQLHVSRATLRRAIETLVNEGILIRERGRGTYVARGPNAALAPKRSAREDGQRSRVIGVMFGLSAGTFHLDLIDGIFAAAEAHDHNVIMVPLTRGRGEAKAARALQGFRFDGLIMLGPQTPTPRLGGRMPVVVVGWHVAHPGVDVVRTSDEAGMAVAVDHLVALGHRRIAHLDGGDTPIGAARTNAFVAAMRRHGLDDQLQVVSGGQAQVDGQRAARALLDQGELPTGLIAYNDDTATAALGVFAQQGIKVPGDISVIGWDDSQAAALSLVGLTSVVQEPARLARLAVERVIARTQRRDVEDREIVLEPVLAVRDSTAGPRSSPAKS